MTRYILTHCWRLYTDYLSGRGPGIPTSSYQGLSILRSPLSCRPLYSRLPPARARYLLSRAHIGPSAPPASPSVPASARGSTGRSASSSWWSTSQFRNTRFFRRLRPPDLLLRSALVRRRGAVAGAGAGAGAGAEVETDHLLHEHLGVDVIVIPGSEDVDVPHHLQHVQPLLQGLGWQAVWHSVQT